MLHCVCDKQRVPFLVSFSMTAVTVNPGGCRLSVPQSYRTQSEDKGTANMSESLQQKKHRTDLETMQFLRALNRTVRV
jgi:hypothetical protein